MLLQLDVCEEWIALNDILGLWEHFALISERHAFPTVLLWAQAQMGVSWQGRGVGAAVGTLCVSLFPVRNQPSCFPILTSTSAPGAHSYWTVVLLSLAQMFFWWDSDHVGQPKTSGCKISHVHTHSRWLIFTINAKGLFTSFVTFTAVQYKNKECYSNMWEESTFLKVNSAGWLWDLKLAAGDGSTQELMSPVSQGLTANNKWANKKQFHSLKWPSLKESCKWCNVPQWQCQVELNVWATAIAPYLKHSGGAKLLQFYKRCDEAIVLHPLARPTKYVSFVQNFFWFKHV